jgi:hypothetical protein
MSGALPNLLIAGAPKAGTSSLFRYLEQHPDICAARAKEIRYFKPLLKNPDGVLADLDEYRAFFSHCRGERYAMEATPSYCYGGRHMVEVIAATLQQPRVIIILREPVSRLWSAYTFQRTKGNIVGVGSFEEYVEVSMRKRAGDSSIGRYFGGVSIGYYSDYLGDWFLVLEDDVRIVFADDLFGDARAVVTEVCRWLEIDPVVASRFDYSVRNKTAHARSPAAGRAARALKKKGDAALARAPRLKMALRSAYLKVNTAELSEKLSPETRARLESFYRPSNLAVAEMLRERGYDRLPPWLQRQPELGASAI